MCRWSTEIFTFSECYVLRYRRRFQCYLLIRFPLKAGTGFYVCWNGAPFKKHLIWAANSARIAIFFLLLTLLIKNKGKFMVHTKFLPQRKPRPNNCSSWPCWGRGLGLGDLQWCQPASTILWSLCPWDMGLRDVTERHAQTAQTWVKQLCSAPESSLAILGHKLSPDAFTSACLPSDLLPLSATAPCVRNCPVAVA